MRSKPPFFGFVPRLWLTNLRNGQISNSFWKMKKSFVIFTISQPRRDVFSGDEGGAAQNLVRGKAERVPRDLDFRPCYFGEGGRLTLPFPILWQNLVRGKGGPTLPPRPSAVRGVARVPHPPRPPTPSVLWIFTLHMNGISSYRGTPKAAYSERYRYPMHATGWRPSPIPPTRPAVRAGLLRPSRAHPP